jgi:hypothetical protein
MRMPADEIDRQIDETPDDVDQNLDILEQRESDARLYGRIAAISLAVLALAGAGYLVYRRVKRPSLAKRLRLKVLDSMRDLPTELPSRLKERIPQVNV